MIVTRFAPSPTGYLHIGGARTALFCYLMARRHEGKMILRIEDTDQKRNTPTATKQVIEDLRWLGIEWDEGPDVEGPNGPYLQSKRLKIYNEYIQQLLDDGYAYYCFDTQDELQHMRDRAASQKKTFIYRKPRNVPDEEQVKKAREAGRPVVVRFGMPGKDIVVNDIVRGKVKFSANEISDFIIQKSDGFPTYHFACVVDDELMGITHVIRGQEHLMNTPQHQALQKALGFKTPEYAHMSVTVSETGGKLSKRERAKTLIKAIRSQPNLDLDKLAETGKISRSILNDFIAGNAQLDQPVISAIAELIELHLPEINVIDFCKSGYIPEALLNFIALLGWNPGDDREVMSKDELIEAFDINRLTKANSLFDRKKLVALNTEHMRRLSTEDLFVHFKKYLELNSSPLAAFDNDTLKTLLEINAGARTLADIDQKCHFLVIDDSDIEFDLKAVSKVLLKGNAVQLLMLTRDVLADLSDWNQNTLHDAIQQICSEQEVGMGKIAQPLRVAITGANISPPIDHSLALLGRDKTLNRIENTLSYIGNAS